MPEYFRITKLTACCSEHRILIVNRPCKTFIITVSKSLVLPVACTSENCDQGRFAIYAEPGAVIPIHYYTAGKSPDTVVHRNRQRHFFPVYQVGTYCMTPTLVSRLSSAWIVLIKQMIFSIIINQPVWITHPITAGGIMKKWTIQFAANLRS